MSEATVPIPSHWRQTVAALLRKNSPGKVLFRKRAWQDWQAIFPDEFEYQLREALASALDDDQLAGKRHEMNEPGETYAFIFCHRSRRMYAKINLTKPDQMVIVYSAHRPLHGEELT